MKHDRFDDPPAPQDPPLQHNPLSPPRPRPFPNPYFSSFTGGGLGRNNVRNSAPVPHLYPSFPTLKPKRSCGNEPSLSSRIPTTWVCHTLSHSISTPEQVQCHQRSLVTTDDDSRASLSPFDTDAFSPLASPKYTTPSPAESASAPQLGAHEFEQASFRTSAHNELSINEENHLSEPTTTMQDSHPRSTLTTPDAHPQYGSSDCLSLGFLPLASSEGHSEGLTELEQAELDSAYSTHSRDYFEADTDSRSMISSVLNVYYRDTEAEEDEHWSPADAISVTLEDASPEQGAAETLENHHLDDESTSSSALPFLPASPPKRRKPISLFLNTTSIWEEAGNLPTMPQTAPGARAARPLPPLPNSPQRSLRPLPQPPAPPEYTPLIVSSSTPDIPSTAFSPMPLARAFSLHTPSVSSSSSATCASSLPSANLSTNFDPSPVPSPPQKPSLPPLLAVSPCDSEISSPLADIPVPPSPGTARRFRVSKASKILGEDLALEFPGLLVTPASLSRAISRRSQSTKISKVLGEDIAVELPGLIVPSTPISPRMAKQSQGSKVSRILGEDIPVELPGLLAPGLPIPPSPKVAKRSQGPKAGRVLGLGEDLSPEHSSPPKPHPALPPSPRTAKRFQASKISKILGEDVPPELMYGQGMPPVQTRTRPNAPNVWDISSRLRARADRAHAIYFDDASEEFDADVSEDAQSQVEVKADHIVDEEEHDQADDRSVFSVNVSLSSEENDDGDLDDTEEAHISWALQTVVTYETASRVKRTSRMWVLEKNGERKEEGNYANVLKALRQL